MFDDQNSKVREAIAWNIRKLCEHHADFVMQSQCIQMFIEKLIKGLQDQPKISF